MMLCIRDETPSGQSLHELSLEFLSERITVRELIRERVHHEVKEFNLRQGECVFRGLVQPTNAERVLNAPHRQLALDVRVNFARPCCYSFRRRRDSAVCTVLWRGVKPGMMKAILLSAASFSFCTSSSRCVAQEVVPVIYLSKGEAAKAKQTTQDLKIAYDRNNRAVTAWRNFYQRYQAAHPELPNLRFASDFRAAFARKNPGQFPLAEAATVELSAEERQQAESVHQEMLEAKRVLDQAQKSWVDYWHELVLAHVTPSQDGAIVALPSGKSATIPIPWANGLVFTPDFRVAVPQ